MNFLGSLIGNFGAGVKHLYNVDINDDSILINQTRSEFEGDFTIVIFPLVKLLNKSPEVIGAEIGTWLVENHADVVQHNTIKGFLNLTMSNEFWLQTISQISSEAKYGYADRTGEKVMVEFSSPNTNKPLHLGHIRNILLGWSTSKILDACGYDVSKVQIINDRGIAICKSMLAWQKLGHGATPASSGIKSDHFVGDYYVEFEKIFQEEFKAWQSTSEAFKIYADKKKVYGGGNGYGFGDGFGDGNGNGGGDGNQNTDTFFKEYKNTYFNTHSELGREAKEMLLRWEAGDAETIALWRKMNQWVYEGFDVTYESLGVSFDKLYFESETYLLGKKIIDKGLANGLFYRQEDGSVWANLEDAGMDRKILLRSDGSSVYMTQDLGTALQRYEDLGVNKMIYTVADEQDYHFKVLFEILKRLQEPYAAGLHHLSYGMIDLTTGKMKSREGTVVDADDLIAEVIGEARSMSAERGEITVLPQTEQDDILRKIGLAALKFFIIKVQPKKRMTFNPEESVDMQGQTGPYIQNAYVRIQSLLRKAATDHSSINLHCIPWEQQEKILIRHLMQFPSIIAEAGAKYEPSLIANYSYELAKDFHRFYHDVRILNAESDHAKQSRIILSETVGKVLATAFDLLGIEMPDRM
jgi:arginyl-tRNA synthetase